MAGTTSACRVVFLALGAGMAGPIILGKATLSDVTTNLQELLFKSQKSDARSLSSDNAAIQEQIMRLTQEVRQIYAARQITLLNASDQNKSLVSYLVPLAVLGAAGYGYMKWKGYTFSDMMYVTKRNMENAISTFNRKLEQVSETLTAAKKYLTQRMDKLDDKLDEQKERTCAIQLEVGHVHEDLSKMGLDIESLQCLLENLETKLDILKGKQDITNKGVIYLCHFVQSQDANPQKLELPQPFLGKTRLPWSSSTKTGLSCVKELKDTLQCSDAFETRTIVPHGATPAGALHLGNINNLT